MKRKHKLIALVLALCLLVVPVLRPHRAAAVETGLITVAGGAIGTGGAAAGFAAGSVVLPVLGVVGAALAAYGINVALTDASQEAGMTKTQFIYSKLGEFAEFAGVDVESMIQGISQNVKVSPTGNILLDAAGGAIMSQFIGWLFDTDSIVESGGVSIGNYNYSVGGLTVYLNDGGQMRYSVISGANDVPVYFIVTMYGSANYKVHAVSPASGSQSRILSERFDANGTLSRSYTAAEVRRFSSSAVCNSVYHYFGSTTAELISASNYSHSDAYNNVAVADFTNYMSYNTIDWGGSTLPADDVFSGNDTLWEENKDLLKPGEDEVTVITPPDVLNPAGAAAGAGEYVVSAPDYLTAVADAINAAGVADAAISVPLTNTATGAYESVNVQAAAVDTSSSVAVDSDGFSGTTGLVDPEAEPSPGDVIDAMRVDVKLEDVFPFSIPYNFFHLLEKFMATPVAPQWDFDYTFPIGDEGYPVHWHMDLTPYESWAVVIRWGVRVGWMATLAGAAQRRIKF